MTVPLQRFNPFLSGDSAIRSLNRVRIAGLPGVVLDPGVAGKNGFELLSSEALHGEILAALGELGLDPASPALLRGFDRCFEDPAVAPRAAHIARLYGRRLGYLLLALARGDACNREARPEWSQVHWAFWKSIRRIWLGGGMISGQLGRHALAAARELLAENGAGGLELGISPWSAHLSLVGLARSAPPGLACMLVLDFGQTSIKRGLAGYARAGLSHLRLLPPVPTVCGGIFEAENSLDQVRLRWQRMLALVAESWAAASPASPAAIGIDLACYLIGGHPSPRDQGCYSALRALAPHLESFMRGEISARLGAPVPLVLMHDGSAAGAAYAGEQDTVVITLGTAAGNGFPPPAEGRWPLEAGFRIEAAGYPIGVIL